MSYLNPHTHNLDGDLPAGGLPAADLYATVARSVAWLDEWNGHGTGELTLRILKVTEEVGEVAQAMIEDSYEGVIAELADVVITAATAIKSLGVDPAASIGAAGTVRRSETLAGAVAALVAESGRVAQAWIGYTGQNPRKGVTHTRRQVADALARVVVTAWVAMRSLGADPAAAVAETCVKVCARFAKTTAATS